MPPAGVGPNFAAFPRSARPCPAPRLKAGPSGPPPPPRSPPPPASARGKGGRGPAPAPAAGSPGRDGGMEGWRRRQPRVGAKPTRVPGRARTRRREKRQGGNSLVFGPKEPESGRSSAGEREKLLGDDLALPGRFGGFFQRGPPGPASRVGRAGFPQQLPPRKRHREPPCERQPEQPSPKAEILRCAQ